jgi:uncharacterized C2H2 Zn-finger protein
MLDLSNQKWKILDKDFLEIETQYIRIVKRRDCEEIPIDCPKCGNLFSGTEDVESYRRHRMCENCELINWPSLAKE